MTTARAERDAHTLRPGDEVELVQPLERHGLRRGARGKIIGELRYWDQVRVDFGRGRRVPVGRDKLRRTA